MRIALTSDPELPVPPRLYGGIERIIDMLARGLAARGHEVDLFAHPDSTAPARLIPWPGRRSRSRRDTLMNAAVLARHVVHAHYDIVHSFSRIAYLTPILPFGIPKLMTYQREISPRTVRFGHFLSRGTLQFTAISEHMTVAVRRQAIGRWHVVPNGVPLDAYEPRFAVERDAPLVFLGRVEQIKGPHLAIEVARRAGHRLVIAGNVPAEHQSWFDANIAPHIDGVNIRFVGPVDDRQKNALLRDAAALLMPILWEEPFGIVMAEAMACGTPVLGLARGAVPEVVAHGETGFVVGTVDELVAVVADLPRIARTACRERVAKFYSTAAVIDAYLRIYEAMCRAR
jgi:glycosyltransferase involved in cell wall biosynthesis